MKSYNRYICSLVLMLIGTVGCSDVFEERFEAEMEIKLKSRITSPVLEVRAAGEGYDYDSEIPGGLMLSLVRWDENKPRTWPSGYEVLSAELEAAPDPQDGWMREIHFDPAQYFSNKTDYVGFMGWYPSEGWTQIGGSPLIEEAGDVKMKYNLKADEGDCPDIMFADFRKGSFNDPIDPMTLRHALCMYRIYVYAVDEDVKLQWGDLKQVNFINLPDFLIADLPDIYPPAQDQNVEFSYLNDSEPDELVMSAGAEGMSLPIGVENRKLLGTVLGGVPLENVLGLKAMTSLDDKEITAVAPVSISTKFKPGSAYSIILRFSTHGIVNAEVVVEEWARVDGTIEADSDKGFFVELSRYGTSNSYVVSSANMGYCFDATVKGNGVNTLTKHDGTVIYLPDTDVSLKTDHVRIISNDAKLKWNGSDYEAVPTDDRASADMIRLISDKLTDGKVLFEVVGSEDKNDFKLQYKGNVRIAAYDVMDNLIWSWHIWITDKPLLINYGNGEISMDRNMGSMSKDPQDWNPDNNALSGVCYQWGRKDPILLIPDSLNKYKLPAPQTIQSAHSNPKSFIYTEGGEGHSHDWLDVSNDHLWGYISSRDDMVKTLYDPCPPGYRVNGNALWEYSTALSTEPHLEYVGDTNVGYTFSLEDGTEVFYPASSFVTHDGQVVRNLDLDNYGQPVEDNGYAYVYRYSATPYVTSDPHEQGLAYYFEYNWKDNWEIEKTQIRNLLKYDEDDGGGRIHAYPVRCVYETSKKEIIDLSREQTANSYIIEESSYYKFDATAPGNSVGSLNVQFTNGAIRNITFDGGVPEVLSSVVKVDVLWWQGDITDGSPFMTDVKDATTAESECPLIMVDGGILDENGDAYFIANMNAVHDGANVILAGFDVNGDIQWTWHMWMVPEGINVTEVCCENNGKVMDTYALMDRNLGATRKIESLDSVDESNVESTYGFFYQWGRKDPFVPCAEHTRNDDALNLCSKWCYKNPSTGVWEIKESLDYMEGRAASIKETIQSPTVFRGSSSANGWQTMYNSQSKNDGPFNQMWGYTGTEGAWGSTFAKTMWDPCPPGYRILNHMILESAGWVLENSGGGVERLYYYEFPTSDLGIFIQEGMSLHERDDNVLTNDYNNLTKGLWLPFSKYLSPAGKFDYKHANYPFSGFIHSACPHSGYGIRSVGYGPPEYGYGAYSRFYHFNTEIHSAYGGTIRCMKE